MLFGQSPEPFSIFDITQLGVVGGVCALLCYSMYWMLKAHREERKEWRAEHRDERADWLKEAKGREELITRLVDESNHAAHELAGVIRQIKQNGPG